MPKEINRESKAIVFLKPDLDRHHVCFLVLLYNIDDLDAGDPDISIYIFYIYSEWQFLKCA